MIFNWVEEMMRRWFLWGASNEGWFADIGFYWWEIHLDAIRASEKQFCRYYTRREPILTCSFSCTDEPQCITNEPADGWPPFPKKRHVITEFIEAVRAAHDNQRKS